jgi:hypothetical protein
VAQEVQQQVVDAAPPQQVQAQAAVEPPVRLPAPVAGAVEVAEVVPQLCQPLVRRDVEAFW